MHTGKNRCKGEKMRIKKESVDLLKRVRLAMNQLIGQERAKETLFRMVYSNAMNETAYPIETEDKEAVGLMYEILQHGTLGCAVNIGRILCGIAGASIYGITGGFDEKSLPDGISTFGDVSLAYEEMLARTWQKVYRKNQEQTNKVLPDTETQVILLKLAPWDEETHFIERRRSEG